MKYGSLSFSPVFVPGFSFIPGFRVYGITFGFEKDTSQNTEAKGGQ